MRAQALLLFFTLFVWPQGSRAEPVLAIDRQQVNIRQDATTQSPRVVVLYQGDQVTELRRHAGWIQIRLADGRIGWVHSALVQPRLIVEGEGVRVRSGPSTREDAVTMVFRGQELGVVEKRGNWLNVTVSDGRSGWIHKRFARSKTDEDIRAVMPARTSLSDDIEEPPEAPVDDIADLLEEAVDTESQFGVDEVPFALRRNPYAEGLQQEAGGDYAAALAQFEEVLVEEPGNVNALFHAAQSQTHLGELAAATELLYRAIELTGGRKDLYLTLSEVYRRKGIPDSAAKYESMFAGQLVTATPSEEGVPREPERARVTGEQASREYASGEEPLAAVAPGEGVDESEPNQKVQVNAAEADRSESAGQEDSAGRLHLFALGSGALALILVAAIWIGVRMGRGGSESSTTKKGREGAGKFSKVIEEESKATGHGRATSEEEEELDRQIDDKWRELRQSSELFAPSQEEQTGGEEGQLNRMLDHVEALRGALDMQDERAVVYADIVRLQNMKIEALNEEIRLLRKVRKS